MEARGSARGRPLMTRADAAGVLSELLGRWQRAFDQHHASEIASLFSPDALFQGVSPHLGHGPEDVFAYYDAVTPGATAHAEVLSAAWLGQAIVHGFADVTFTMPGGDIRLVRLSVVAGGGEDGWLIHHYHAATRE
ncbi:nuclear transport factor 2 family protein [Nonomuraea dietziae]|uniref:nuclear transport factor 2 family protein n=1 Tax=Nonomuraea dietziae TaxID=65515 RepID=UPI003432CF44